MGLLAAERVLAAEADLDAALPRRDLRVVSSVSPPGDEADRPAEAADLFLPPPWWPWWPAEDGDGGPPLPLPLPLLPLVTGRGEPTTGSSAAAPSAGKTSWLSVADASSGLDSAAPAAEAAFSCASAASSFEVEEVEDELQLEDDEEEDEEGANRRLDLDLQNCSSVRHLFNS